jgi:hypothetical protein
MSSRTPRRTGRLVFVAFIAGVLVFAAVVIWLVTGPVRALKQPAARPAEAPAAPTPGGR